MGRLSWTSCVTETAGDWEVGTWHRQQAWGPTGSQRSEPSMRMVLKGQQSGCSQGQKSGGQPGVGEP